MPSAHGNHDETQTAPEQAVPFKLRSRRIRVEITAGPASGTVVELPGHGARIGSGPNCNLVVTDPTVSRDHLMLRIEGEAIRVTDNRSRNGTWLDGVRIMDAFAKPDSVLRMGATHLRLRMLDSSIDVPISARDRFGALVGRSVTMRRLFGLLERVAPSDMTLLIEGETGTGKELVADAVHQHSSRQTKPFVVFDCSAISPTLIEDELFGHAKGAFTDAQKERPGRFEEAHGGTLFLDEIGELPLDLQPKLLRILERREVRRIGDNQTRRVDVRIIAATNRSLAVEVERGRFRDDLYHRLAEVVVHVPPLRHRPEDIPLLARHLEGLVREGRPELPPLAEEAIHQWQEMSFPGNVRELRNCVRRALLLGPEGWQSRGFAQTAAASYDDFERMVRLDEPLLEELERIKDGYERAYLRRALQEAGNNVTRAAELAGVGRRYVQRAMERLGMREHRPEERGR